MAEAAAVAAGLLAVCVVARVLVGSTAVGFPEGVAWWRVAGVRLERVWPAVLVGASLALSGLALQGLLRNALAEPFVLGLASGAGLGAAVQATIGVSLGVWPGPLYLGATAGSAGALALVYTLGRRRGEIDPLGLLLAGVVVGTIAGSGVMLVRALAGSDVLRETITRWMMGHLDASAGWGRLAAVGVVTLAGGVWLWRVGRWLDAASL
ncbi:MAG: iron chelate uptake ABC transporter family permease subunit, partial [Planctomycetota bacterium]